MLIDFKQSQNRCVWLGGPMSPVHTKAVWKEDAQAYSPGNTHPRKKPYLYSRKTPTLSLIVITVEYNQKGFWRIKTLQKARR